MSTISAKTPDYDSPAQLKTFLEERGMSMQKKFGQNFLVNRDARRRLIDALQVEEGTTVWEVGPGLGAMTDEMLRRGCVVTAFEIDHCFADTLRQIFAPYIEKGQFTLVEGDVLKTWKPYFKEHGLPQRFFGNLPYNVAAAIVADMISEGARFDRSIITVQKEVAERMAAKFGTDNYSSFSVLCQWAYDVTNVMDLAGGCFWPRPNVDSRSVAFVKKDRFPCCKDPKLFMTMLRVLFAQRRKTIKNNLNTMNGLKGNVDTVLERAGIAANIRAETLSGEQMLALSDVLYDFFAEQKTDGGRQ
ncbi:MAG: 16S rRNA (adenine(1518)-N(6)/adenine(1519)-N(6))-dimethyltransferase RsmA [Treponemataceae bacterium]|nr:16S rRNA (adenine(1518)-N(6)/adenine(1519)-N(6))-dimethyltransferase RsmA [Treponemataceae bacterium]